MSEAYFIDPGLEARFWKYTEPSNGCWHWRGYVNPRGYGRLACSEDGKFRQLRAYVVAWEIANRSRWPEGKIACHSCDNANCVNPDHIRPGTHKENSAEALERGLYRGCAIENLKKTHCIHGHPLSGDNLKIVRGKWRRCRECERRAKRDCKRRAREAAL